MPDPENNNSHLKKKKVSAIDRLTRYLARRDHSERELIEKLSPFHEKNEIQKALEYAKESKWLTPPQILSRRIFENLNHKGKSNSYIQHVLKKKGLPYLTLTDDKEAHKAYHLVIKHFGKEQLKEYNKKQKIMRWLAYRGYSSHIIQKVLNEEF